MALPTSGSLSLAQIQTEFGGDNPIQITEYYRGGAYTTTNNTNVPTSGQMSIGNFLWCKEILPWFCNLRNAWNILSHSS